MQQKAKNQILHLLSLDSMISQYLNDSVPFKRRKHQVNTNIGNLKLSQNKRNKSTISQKFNTVQATPKTSSKRTNSSFNMRKTLDSGQNQISKGKKNNSSHRIFNVKSDKKEDNQKNVIDFKKDEEKKIKINQIFTSEIKEESKPIEIEPKKQFKSYTMVNLKKNIKPKPTSIYDWKSKKLRDRYLMEKIIGRGLSGVVYKAKDVLAERHVAIKVINQDNVEYEFIKQFQHSNLISYYNNFVEGEKRFLVLEYLPLNLNEVVRKQKLNQQTVKRIFKEIASGILYLHSLSFVHRDIKLDNILTNEQLTQIKFIDFGLCLDTSKIQQNQLKQLCGTSSYMSPEVIQRKCKDAKKADIWSLGIVLYILCVGRAPFKGKQQFEVFQKITNNKTIFPHEMNEKLKNLLGLMLKKNPTSRPTIIEVMNHQWLNQ